MSKLETAKCIATDALELLAQARWHQSAQVHDPLLQLLLQFEYDMGGRQALLDWLDSRMGTLAVEWVRMDERRHLLSDLTEVVVPALTDLHRIFQASVQSETVRHKNICRSKRGNRDIDYLEVARNIMSQGITEPHKRRLAFLKALKEKGGPEGVSDRTIRKYFAQAKAA